MYEFQCTLYLKNLSVVFKIWYTNNWLCNLSLYNLETTFKVHLLPVFWLQFNQHIFLFILF